MKVLTNRTISSFISKLNTQGIPSQEAVFRINTTLSFINWLSLTKHISESDHIRFRNELSRAKNEYTRPQAPLGSFPLKYVGFSLAALTLLLLGVGIYFRFYRNEKSTFAYSTAPLRAGRIISFQGRMTDTLGNPITAPIDVSYSFYTAPTGGSPITGSTRVCTASPDQDGVFNSLIGNDTGPSCNTELPSTIFSENTNVYLGITIGSEITEMSPRQQIANVGYAINSETLQGMPPGQNVSNIPFINQDGDMLIAASNPGLHSTYASSNFTISSAQATTIQSAGSGDITLSATEGGVLRFKTYSGTLGERMTILANGNVGIGNTNPSVLLSVGGNATVSGSLVAGGQIKLGEFGSAPTTYGNGSMYYDTSTNKIYYWNGTVWTDLASSSSQYFQRTLGSLAPTNITDDLNLGAVATGSAMVHLPGLTNKDAFFNLGTGNVGIGTTAPGAPLDVRRDQNASTYIKVTNGTAGTAALAGFAAIRDGTAGLAFRAFSASYTTSGLDIANSGQFRTDAGLTGGMIFTTGTTAPLIFGDNSTETMRITGSKLGIGTTSPGYKLDVSNGAGIVGQFSGRVIGGNAVNTNEFATLGQIAGGAGQYWQRNLGVLSPTTLADDINLGATATTSALIHLPGQTNQNAFFNLGTGNVGIGTTTPVTKLQISKDGAGFGDTAEQLTISGSTNTNKRLQIGFETTSNFGWIQSEVAGTGYNNLILNPNGGNVGIGTTAPTAKLQIAMDDATPTSVGFLAQNTGGSELITATNDRTFAGAGNWTGTSWAVSTGVFLHTIGDATAATLANANLTTSSIVNGRTYAVTFTVGSMTAGTITPRIGTATGSVQSANGTYTVYITAAANNADLSFLPTTAFDGSLDTISVTRVTNNLSLLNSGKLGLGVTAPTRMLDIIDNTVTTGQIINLNSSSITSGAGLYMNLGTASVPFTGNFLDLRNNTNQRFYVNYKGGINTAYTTAVAGEAVNLHTLAYTNTLQTASSYYNLSANTAQTTITSALTDNTDEPMDQVYEGFKFNSGAYNNIAGVRVRLHKLSTALNNGYIVAYLRADNAGVPATTNLATGTVIYTSNISTSPTNYDLGLLANLSTSTDYWIVFARTTTAASEIVFDGDAAGTALWANSADNITWTAQNNMTGYYYIYTRSASSITGNSFSGNGIYGVSNTGSGIYANSTSGVGLQVGSSYNYGISGTAYYGLNLAVTSPNAAGIALTSHNTARSGTRISDSMYNTWYTGDFINAQLGFNYATNYFLYYDGTNYTNRTTEAANSSGNAYTVLADNNDIFYFGRTTSSGSYRQLFFDLSNTPNVSGIAWEYSTAEDGGGDCTGWTAGTPTVDETNGLTRDGTVGMPAGTPIQCKVNGSDAYWFRLSASTVTTGVNAYATNWGMYTGYFARLYGTGLEKVRIDYNGNTATAGYLFPGSNIEGAAVQVTRGLYDTLYSLGVNTHLYVAGNAGIGSITPNSKLEVSGATAVVADPAGTLGTEKTANPNFGTVPDTNWTWGTGWSHDTTLLDADHAAGTASYLEQPGIVAPAAGEIYRFGFTVSNYTAGTIQPCVGGVCGTAVSANGAYVQTIIATGNGNIQLRASATFAGTVDTITVRQMNSGNTAVAGLYTGGGTTGLKILSGGNVGIGITAPVAKLDILGNLNVSTYATVSASLALGTSNAAAGPGHLDMSGNLTIAGAIEPGGAVGTTGYLLTSSAGGVNTWTDPTTLGSGFNLWQRTLGSIAPKNITDDVNIGAIATGSALVHLPGLTNQNAWFNLGTGNVGIGTTNPNWALDVQAPSARSSVTSTTGTNFAMSQYVNGGDNLIVGINRSTVGGISAGALGYAGVINVSGAHALQFGTNNTIQTTLDSAGNLGIGTTGPNAKLDVVGTASVSGVLTVGNGTTNQIQSPYGPLTLNYKSGLNAWSAGLTLQDSTGYVGIGDNTPEAFLQVDGGSKPRILSGKTYTVNGSPGTAILTNGTSYEYPGIVGIGNQNITTDIPSIDIYGSVGVVGVGGSYTGGRTNVGIYGHSYFDAALGGNAGNVLQAGRFTSRLTSNVTDFNGVMYGVYSKADTTGGTSTGGSVYGTYSQALGETNNNTYGGYFTASGGTTNYGVYSAAGTNYFSGNVGIGTTSPNAKLDVSGTASISGILTLGNGATNQLQSPYGPLTLNYKSSLAGYTAGITLQDTTGNVGIGTTNPLASLDVTGTVKLNGATSAWFNGSSVGIKGTTYLLSEGANQTVLIGRYSTESLSMYVDDSNAVIESIQDENSAGYGNLIFRVDNDSTANGYFAFQNKSTSEFMRITSGGDVGIGITAPTAKLDVNGNLNVSSYATVSASLALGTSSAAAGPGNLNMSGNLTISGAIKPGGAAGTTGYLLTSSAGGVNTWTDPSTLGSGFNLWQRTLGSVAPLNITDDVNIGAIATGSAMVHLPGLTNQNAFFNLGTGNVGIGTTNPQQALDVNGNLQVIGTGVIQLKTAASTYLQLKKSGTVDAEILSGTGNLILQSSIAGNIGIGTTSPTAKLDVNGNLNVSTYATVSASLALGTSNAAAGPGHLDMSGNLTIAGAIKPGGAVGTNGYLLTSSAGGVNTWTDPTNISGVWQRTLGSLAPLNITDDINIGAVATGSALVHLPGLTNKNAFFNLGTGNVGIGITAPTTTLHVYGTSTMRSDVATTLALSLYHGASTGTNVGVNSRMGSANSGTSVAVKGYADGAGTGTNVGGNFYASGATNHTALVLGSATLPTGNYELYSVGTNNSYFAGNVGIGITAPNAKLDVTGTASISGVLTVGDGTTNRIRAPYGPLYMDYKTTPIGGYTAGIVLQDTTGNVGIGINDPTSALHLSGGDFLIDRRNATGSTTRTITIRGARSGANSIANEIIFQNYDNVGGTVLDDYTGAKIQLAIPTGAEGGSLFFQTADGTTLSTQMVIDSFGNVGIGTTAPTAKLDVVGNLNVSSYATVSASLALGTSSAAAGPGNLNMSGNLTISGAIKPGGAAGTTGYLLTSSAGGVNTWTDPSTLAGTNYWQRALGSLAPLNITDDINIGAVATGSAMVHLPGLTNKNAFFNLGTGIVGIGTSAPTLGKLQVVGGNIIVDTTNGIDTATAGTLALGDTTAATISIGSTAGTAINVGAGGSLARAISIGTGTGIDTINIGTGATGVDVIRIGQAAADLALTDAQWSISNTGAFSGVTGAFTTSITTPRITGLTTDGVVYVSGANGTLNSEATLATARGGLGANMTAAGAGELPYSTSTTAYGRVAAGTTNYILKANGAAAPSWVDPATLGLSNFWQRTLGSLAPLNITDDVNVGAIATGSAMVHLPGLTNKNAFFNLGTGNMGIGTTNPIYKFQVHNSASQADIAISTDVNIGSANTTQLSFVSDLDGTPSYSSIGQYNTADLRLSGAGNLVAPDMLIKASNGNVGIGTTGPNAKLDVSGTASISGILTLGNGVTNQLQSPYGPLTLNYKSSLAGYTAGITLQDTTGNVGIGTTNPLTKLAVSGGYIIIDNNYAYSQYDSGGTARTLIWLDNAATNVLHLRNNQAGTGGPIVFDTGTVEKMRVDTGGNVGIGITAPTAKLDILGNLNVSTYATVGASLAVGYNNVPAGPGHAIFQGNVGIGTAAPGTKLEISGTNGSFRFNPSQGVSGEIPAGTLFSSNSDNLTLVPAENTGTTGKKISLQYFNQTGWLSGLELANVASGYGNLILMKSGGNVGIGTTAPAAKLAINGGLHVGGDTDPGDNNLWVDNEIQAVKFTDKNSSTYYVSPGNGAFLSGNIRIDSSVSAASKISFVDTSLGSPTIASISAATNTAGGYSIYLTSGAQVGNAGTNVCVGDPSLTGGGVPYCNGKIDAGTVDPPYTINGKRYATYVASMTGVKEETTGHIALTTKSKTVNGYEYVIDFNAQTDGSDLWLFAKTTALRTKLDRMSVLMSPSDNARTWYKIDSQHQLLTLYSSRPTTISYRLTAPRFDETKWKNVTPNGSDGHIVNDPDIASLNDIQIDGNGNVSGQLVANAGSEGGYQVLDEMGSIVEETVLQAKTMSAHIVAGLLEAQKIISPLAEIETLIVKNKITSPIIETDSLKASNSLEVPVVKTNEIQIGAQPGQLAALVIKGLNNAPVIRIDETGNATFSGVLTAQSMNSNQLTTNNASVAGTLVAKNVQSENINTIESNVASLSSTLASSTSQFASDINAVQQELASIKSQPLPNPAYYQNIDASYTNLTVSDTANIYKAHIADSLVVGTLFIQPSSILALSNDLRISSLGTIRLFDDAVVIAKNGDMAIRGEVAASSLAIKNSEGTIVASIDASGSARFNEVIAKKFTLDTIATQGAVIADSGIRNDLNVIIPAIKTNKEVAGTGTVPQDTKEVIIYNDNVTDNSLIYLTPTTNNIQGQLSVSKKVSCPTDLSRSQLISTDICSPYFIVSSSSDIHVPSAFNWLIIN